MTPLEIRERRLELGLTLDELAFALNIGEADLALIEKGLSELHRTPEFQEAFERLEERVFATIVGAPVFV